MVVYLVNGQLVDVPGEPLTNSQLRALDVDVADSGEREYVHVVATVTAAGSTVIHTPSAGKSVRLRWIYAVNNPTADTAPLIDISLGAMPVYRAYAISKRQRKTGPIDGQLTISLSTPGSVAVTAILEEV